MEKKGKVLKIHCDCGGMFKQKIQRVEGFNTEALVCSNCKHVTMTTKQIKKLLELRRMFEAIGKERRVVRIGNTYGVTFPPKLVHQGQKVNIRPLAPNRYILSFAK